MIVAWLEISQESESPGIPGRFNVGRNGCGRWLDRCRGRGCASPAFATAIRRPVAPPLYLNSTPTLSVLPARGSPHCS